ncbi:MAG: EAL domain-containing protein, partial [Eubacterium sp.]|nr:EAL domain-containing protein [Eubacterium sp.]
FLSYMNTQEHADNRHRNKQNMNDLMERVYQHQAGMYRHISEKNPSKKAVIEDNNEQLENKIFDILSVLSDSIKGTEYESEYHNIFNEVTGYFKNIDIIFDFSKENDTRTADYYMDNFIDPSVAGLNDQIRILDNHIEKSIEDSKNKAGNSYARIRHLAFVIMILLVAMTVVSVLLCVHIAKEMTDKDALTGVLNFDALIKVATKYKRKNKLSRYNGLAVSIRDFKYINQEYGSAVGDIVLIEYSRKLSEYLYKGEIIARNGADNFIVLIEHFRVEGFLDLIEEMRIDVGNDVVLPISSRCGIYDISEEDTIHDVVSAGLIALGTSRVSSTDSFVWFHEKGRKQIIKQKEILTGYKRAISEEEFVVYYQPKVEIATGKLCGCEALVRWFKDGTLVPPNSFIPVLEDDGKIQELDFYVFRKVCRDVKEWLARGIEPVRISSNFSKLHLHNRNFISDVKSIIEDNEVNTDYLEAELTESSGYEDLGALQEFVNSMAEIGVHTSMDDFGTGYSSLSLLKDVDTNVVKLDRSFLRDVEKGDKKDLKLIENVVHMIHDMNRHVLCEGVETEKQAKILLDMGCHIAQGYLYDKPLTRDEFEKRLINPQYDIRFD